jgi:hypothetical protein
MYWKFGERVAVGADGAIAVYAILKNAPSTGAIITRERDVTRVVAKLGDEAPGGGTYANFGLWPALGRPGEVAFVASVDGGPSPIGIFVTGAGAPRKIAAIGDRVQGGDVLRSFALYPVLAMSPRGDVSFAIAPFSQGGGVDAIVVAPPLP